MKLITLFVVMLLVFGLASFAAAFDAPGAPDIAGIVFIEGAALGNDIATGSPALFADFKSCETGTFKDRWSVIRIDNTAEIGNGPQAYDKTCLGSYVATVPAIVRNASAGEFMRSNTYYKTYTGPGVLIAHNGKGGCCFGGFVERYAV